MAVKNILVIKIGAMGDLLLSTPAIRSLKKSFPGARVSLLVGASVKEVIERNPYVDDVIEMDDHLFFKGPFLRKVKMVVRLIRKIRKGRYDLAVLFHRDVRYGPFIWMCNIPERVGFRRSVLSRLFLTKSASIEGARHHVSHYLELAKLCGASRFGEELDFTVRAEVRERARKNFLEHGIDPQRLVGISPGGASNVKNTMDTKRWPEESYKALIDELVRDGFQIVLFGSENDLTFLRGWEMPEGVKSMINTTTLEQTAAFMELCRVVVANDSGPMHLASTMKVPVVSIFGPTDPREMHPLSEGSFYFWKGEDMDCAPCYLDGSFPECETKQCMTGITVTDVYNKLIEVVKEQRRYLYKVR